MACAGSSFDSKPSRRALAALYGDALRAFTLCRRAREILLAVRARAFVVHSRLSSVVFVFLRAHSTRRARLAANRLFLPGYKNYLRGGDGEIVDSPFAACL
jgi:hypothetical protein